MAKAFAMKTVAHTGEKARRRTIRLRVYDYSSPGAYFVTICTQGHQPLFLDERIRGFAEQCWMQIPRRFRNVRLDQHVIMVNHIHAILWILPADAVGAQNFEPADAEIVGAQDSEPADAEDVGAQNFEPARPERSLHAFQHPVTRSLGTIVRAYKSAVTMLCRREGFASCGWQRNYYERVIRNDEELKRIRQYIADNPLKWGLDPENPQHQYDPGYRREWGWLHGG